MKFDLMRLFSRGNKQKRAMTGDTLVVRPKPGRTALQKFIELGLVPGKVRAYFTNAAPTLFDVPT